MTLLLDSLPSSTVDNKLNRTDYVNGNCRQYNYADGIIISDRYDLDIENISFAGVGVVLYYVSSTIPISGLITSSTFIKSVTGNGKLYITNSGIIHNSIVRCDLTLCDSTIYDSQFQSSGTVEVFDSIVNSSNTIHIRNGGGPLKARLKNVELQHCIFGADIIFTGYDRVLLGDCQIVTKLLINGYNKPIRQINTFYKLYFKKGFIQVMIDVHFDSLKVVIYNKSIFMTIVKMCDNSDSYGVAIFVKDANKNNKRHELIDFEIIEMNPDNPNRFNRVDIGIKKCVTKLINNNLLENRLVLNSTIKLFSQDITNRVISLRLMGVL